MSAVEAIGGLQGPDAAMRPDPTRVASQVEQRRIARHGEEHESTSSGGFLARPSVNGPDRAAGMRELARSLHVDEGVLADGLGNGATLSQILQRHGVTDDTTMPVQLQGVLFDRYL